MRVVGHASDELAIALRGRELAKLRMIAVENAELRVGRVNTISCWVSRRAYHEATLVVLGCMIRHSKLHRAAHRAAMRRAS